jgi:hypothetical protein
MRPSQARQFQIGKRERGDEANGSFPPLQTSAARYYRVRMIGPEFDEIARRVGVSPGTARLALAFVGLAGCFIVIGLRLFSR